MIEITGWVVLSPETTGEYSQSQTNDLVLKVSRLIKSIDIINQFVTLQDLNGTNYLLIAINHNHDNGVIEEVMQIIKRIGQLSVGSYGIVYVRNHESGDSNSYNVIRLARGELDIFVDSLLSPCNPTIED